MRTECFSCGFDTVNTVLNSLIHNTDTHFYGIKSFSDITIELLAYVINGSPATTGIRRHLFATGSAK
ncbi:hypothetical protein D3C87_2128830 [compost metagenome]